MRPVDCQYRSRERDAAKLVHLAFKERGNSQKTRDTVGFCASAERHILFEVVLLLFGVQSVEHDKDLGEDTLAESQNGCISQRREAVWIRDLIREREICRQERMRCQICCEEIMNRVGHSQIGVAVLCVQSQIHQSDQQLFEFRAYDLVPLESVEVKRNRRDRLLRWSLEICCYK